jgi:hypothetical protein
MRHRNEETSVSMVIHLHVQYPMFHSYDLKLYVRVGSLWNKISLVTGKHWKAFFQDIQVID